MRTIGVRLQRLDLYDGPIAVRLVDLANNSHHDPGLITDGALAERLVFARLGRRDSAEGITRKLSANPSEAAFSTKWVTFEHAIEHWTGEQSRSPVKRVAWTCLNVVCGFVNGIEIGARRHETVPLRCRQCERTQQVGLGGKN